MSKILNAAAFATGYVLGTRAGRGRYEQIVRTAQRVREDAPDLASQVVDQATGAASGSSSSGSGSSSSTGSSSTGSGSSGSSSSGSGTSGSGTEAAASTPMYSAPTPDAGPAPDDAGSADDATPGGTAASTPMYSAPTPGSGTAPEGGSSGEGGAHAADRPTDAPSGAGTQPVPPVGHTEVEEEVVYSSGPDVDAPIEELTEDDPR
ncbi:hypothetical protein [Aeromicrobium sp. IC_218]|uniref:hypothetical protein n=1 Tax=Aeromicrobium sp. IC_218 TaxID=2545468 RepID=UPI001038E4EE|nr:hypothetical protein [Aeromicrobium sp. IC_218]TCJ00205.1 hypothetical protein E0W78_03160 [Aeromicrobium sp. IC_218]